MAMGVHRPDRLHWYRTSRYLPVSYEPTDCTWSRTWYRTVPGRPTGTVEHRYGRLMMCVTLSHRYFDVA
jgi:hypothetical protein